MVHSELLFNLLGNKKPKKHPFWSDIEVTATVFVKKDVSTHVRVDVRVFRGKISIS